MSCSAACSSSGFTGPPASTRKPSVPGPAATRYVFDSQSGCIERATIMAGTLVRSRGVELIHTCYRIGEIDRSVAFYEALGFEERRRVPIREEAINVFMGLPGDGDRLELTYNFGVDSYELGTGYNHIALTVSDLDAILAGGSRICFVRDPDGYRVELIERP